MSRSPALVPLVVVDGVSSVTVEWTRVSGRWWEVDGVNATAVEKRVAVISLPNNIVGALLFIVSQS